MLITISYIDIWPQKIIFGWLNSILFTASTHLFIPLNRFHSQSCQFLTISGIRTQLHWPKNVPKLTQSMKKYVGYARVDPKDKQSLQVNNFEKVPFLTIYRKLWQIILQVIKFSTNPGIPKFDSGEGSSKQLTSVSKNPGQHLHCNCDFNLNFLANYYFIFQISHAKTFTMRHTRCLYTMALPVMEFQDQGYKIRKVFA